jgi:hypothetical protein
MEILPNNWFILITSGKRLEGPMALLLEKYNNYGFIQYTSFLSEFDMKGIGC